MLNSIISIVLQQKSIYKIDHLKFYCEFYLVAGASEDTGPVLSSLCEYLVVLLELSRNHSVLGIIRLWSSQQRLDTQQHRPQSHGSSPLILQNVQTDGAGHTGDVGVPDLGDEPHLHQSVISDQSRSVCCIYLGRREGISVRDLDLQFIFPPGVRSVRRSGHLPGQLCQVVIDELQLDTRLRYLLALHNFAKLSLYPLLSDIGHYLAFLYLKE